MLTKIRLLVLLFSINGLASSFGQQGFAPDSLTLEAMGKINFLIGKWSGDGWILIGKEKRYFTQSESVVPKVNNAVIVIDGLGTDKGSKKIIHNAFAIISYDLPGKKYLMRAFRADGKCIDADASIDDGGNYIWGFSLPQAGRIKYTIRLVDGRWVEKGEISRDGNTWIQFFEMILTKE